MMAYTPFSPKVAATIAASATKQEDTRHSVANAAGVATTPNSDFEERAAICEFDGGLPRAHAEVLAGLHAMPCPDGLTDETMGRVIDAAAIFLEKRNLKSRVRP